MPRAAQYASSDARKQSAEREQQSLRGESCAGCRLGCAPSATRTPISCDATRDRERQQPVQPDAGEQAARCTRESRARAVARGATPFRPATISSIVATSRSAACGSDRVHDPTNLREQRRWRDARANDEILRRVVDELAVGDLAVRARTPAARSVARARARERRRRRRRRFGRCNAKLNCLPIGSSFGQYRFANDSLTTATNGRVCVVRLGDVAAAQQRECASSRSTAA